ncbi:MAG: BspA family leucine-rich repeat surface protein [Candidatus Nanosyncoccaceae bacterium]|jgi:surface protein
MFARHTKIKIIPPVFIGLAIAFLGLFGVVQTIQAAPLYGDASLFVTRWQTNVAGATEPKKVTLRFKDDPIDTYQVSWNCNDIYEPFNTKLAEHTYAEAGAYDVCLKSTTPLHFYAPDLATDERNKLLEIKQWGHIPWSSFRSAFYGMGNIQLTASDTPDLSAVTDMSSAFGGLARFTGNESMNTWNTINVTNMSKTFMNSPKFNAPIGGWKTDNVEDMSGMFRSAKAFNQPIGSWNTENVKDMSYMFGSTKAFNQPIGNWTTSSVSNMRYMFYAATKFNNGKESGESSGVLNWNTSSVSNMNTMFYGATSFNQDISNFKISSLTNAGNMLNNSGLSTEHYDALLNSWAEQSVIKSNVAFGAAGIYYCTAKPAIDFLTDDYNWSITNAGSNCPPQNLSLSNTEVYENTTAVGYVSATDEGAITYTLVDGAGDEDNTKFSLDSSTGALSFVAAPDYESPNDLGDTPGNNTYSIRVRATDTTSLYSETIFIITVLDVDEVDPVITITAPIKSHNDDITGIIIQVVDNAEIEPSGVSIGGSSTAGPESLTCQADGVNKVNCTVTVTQSGELIIQAEDEAGNSASKSEDGFLIDRIAPVVSIDPPVTATSSNQTSYILAGGCTAGDKKPTITIGGQSHAVDCIASRWTLTTDLSSYTDGDIAVSIQQTDAVGNVGTANNTIFKDTIAPSADIDSLITNSKSPALTGSVSESTATVIVTIDGNDYLTTNNGTGTWILSAGDITDLADGTYTIDLTVSDALGNTHIYNFMDVVTVDTNRPTVTVNQAATQADPTNINDIKFTIIFSESLQTDLAKEDLTLTGTTTGVVSDVTKISDTEYMASAIGLASNETILLFLGSNKVKDLAGNFNTASTSVDNSVTYDVTPPVGTINPMRPTTNTRPGFSGTVDDNDATVTVEIDSTNYSATNNNGTWSLTTNVISELIVGNHAVKVTFADAVGNESTKTIDLIILPNKISLDGQTDNQGADNAVNQAIIESLAGTCQAGVMNANSLAGGLTAPEANVIIIGGITYQLSCEELGGNAVIDITLGEYYSDLASLRIYKQQSDNLIDITSKVNLRNEGSQTKLTMTLIDGADYDEDREANYVIVDPFYVGVYKEPPVVPKGGVGKSFPIAALVATVVGVILWRFDRCKMQMKA